jgi:hypothetical protein
MGNRAQQMTSRILLQNATGLWHLCTVVFNRCDGSLYLFPFGSLGQYFYGKFCLPAGVKRQDFNYTNQFTSPRVPKVSVHATGWVQIEESTGANTVGPLYIPRLATLKDAIIATISVTDVAKLRTTNQRVDTDLVIRGDRLSGLTAAVYLNGASTFRHRFGSGTRLVKAQLPAAKGTMYMGIEVVAAKPSTADGSPAFELLVGSNPMCKAASAVEMLFIVGQ